MTSAGWHETPEKPPVVNSTVEAALVGALAAIGAQGVAFLVQGRLKDKEFERLDSGVRRQVEALVEQVGRFVFIARTLGPLDWTKMGAFVDRLESRIYLWEVSTALTDQQADALYRAAGDIEVAYRFALQNKWGESSEDPRRDYAVEREQCRGTFNDACGSLAEFWKAMGKQRMSDDFAKHYDKPPEPEPEPAA